MEERNEELRAQRKPETHSCRAEALTQAEPKGAHGEQAHVIHPEPAPSSPGEGAPHLHGPEAAAQAPALHTSHPQGLCTPGVRAGRWEQGGGRPSRGEKGSGCEH